MRTFRDQAAALVEQGDRPQGVDRSAALKPQCKGAGHTLDRLERLKGLF
jgi:hypothetical protein